MKKEDLILRKKKQRILSMLLVVACLISVMAVPAFASELYDKQVMASSSGEDNTEQAENPADVSAKDEATARTSEKPAETQESSEPVAESNESKAEGSKTEEVKDEEVTIEEVKESASETEKKEEKSEPGAGQKDTEESSEKPALEKETAGTEPDPEPKSLDEMTDEEILIAGESMLKTAKELANKEGVFDITFSGDDLALWLRYQEVKRAAQATPGGRRMLKAASNQAEIQRIYARNYGDLLNYVSAWTAAWGSVHTVGTHVHYDTNTNNAVYCANINRHFVDSTIYEVAGQWKDDEMYSALSYTFNNGVKKLNGLASKKYTTGNSSRDWYATQMVVWAILHDYGIKDQKGEDAGLDMATTQPVAGYEDCFNMMRKLYNDAKYFASKQANGTSEDPWYVMENPDYKLILQGKTDVPFYITSAEEPVYTLDVKKGSTANDATVQLYKKNYTGAQQWQLEKSDEEGYYYFKNVNSGKYLEVEGDGGANGDDIQQHSKNGSDGQKWKIIASSDGTVQFAPKVAPDKRIDIKSGVFVNGTNVQLYKSNNTKAQQFRCEPADVRVKNVSDDGKYIQSDWIDVEAKGDLVSREFSLVGAPKGATIVYQNANDPMSKVAVRVPISSIPAGGQCDFQIKVDAVFNKPTISYLAINNSDAQELLVAGNAVQVTASDRLAVYTVPIYGGVKIYKRDADTKGTAPQGDATLKGATFEIVNKSGYAVLVNGTEYADGKVVKTITTDDKGYAATGAKELQVGTYLIREKTAPTGYLGTGVTERTFEITAKEEGTLVDMTASGKSIHNNVIRGGVRIKKQDSDYKDDAAQGDATLKGAEYTITNKSKASVVVGGKEYAPNADVITINTNDQGIAETAADTLPYGTYEIRETKQSDGYLLNTEWKQTFAIRENGKIVDLTKEPCNETVIRGGVLIEKRDLELDKNEALGGASLAGIEFTVTNASPLRVLVDGESYEPGAVITTILTDEEGHASLPENCLPYGTYTIQETKTNDSYLLTDGKPRTFEIREDKKIVTVDTSKEELNFRDQVVRNDFHFNKIADSSNARMGKTAFVVTMLKTGEQHVIVTDRNGVYNSKSKVNPHSQNTNGNDFVLEKYAGEEDVIPSEELDHKAGLWFSLGQKGSEAQVQDSLGALPYGDYRLQELRCESNIGYKLLDIRFYVETDQTVEPIIDLGTLTDDEEAKPEIKTTAVADDNGTHETQAGKATTIVDTVTYKNLKPGVEYTMHGTLMIVPDGAKEAEPLLLDGEPVKAEKTFTPEKADGAVEMTFVFDSSALAGTKTVVFEEVRKGSLMIAAHADPEDEGQQVSIIDIGTTATDEETGTHTTQLEKEDVIVDTVRYSGLTPGKKYEVKGTLMDAETGKELQVNGKTIKAQKEFVPEKADGTVEIEFTVDTTELAGKTFVVFEDLYRNGRKIAVHADIKDEGQSITVITIGTKARDKASGTQEAEPSKTTTIVDKVTYTGLMVGKTYVVKGVLMDKETGKELQINGKTVTAEKEFKAEKSYGSVELEFVFDSSALAGKSIVVFEDLYHEGVKVTSHADLSDKDQTVTIKNPEPTPTPTPTPQTPTVTPTPSKTTIPSTPVTESPKGDTLKASPVKTGDNSKTAFYLILMVIAGIGGGGMALMRLKRK